ncbi:hypothetical protein GCM10009650_15080 [Nesterenkonia jeotgali]
MEAVTASSTSFTTGVGSGAGSGSGSGAGSGAGAASTTGAGSGAGVEVTTGRSNESSTSLDAVTATAEVVLARSTLRPDAVTSKVVTSGVLMSVPAFAATPEESTRPDAATAAAAPRPTVPALDATAFANEGLAWRRRSRRETKVMSVTSLETSPCSCGAA